MFAQNSKADIRFGAFIEKDERILGYGWCRRSKKRERQKYRVDYCVHAEEAALFMALESGKRLVGSTLYVAGFLKHDRPFFKKSAYFTCRRCARRVLIPHNIPVHVPTKSGWQGLTPDEAMISSQKFFKKGFWGKVAKGKHR